MSTTRERAKAAAMVILSEGQRPTAERVRQAIGQGSQQTILTALDEFWAEVGERVREPRFPDALVTPVRELWSQAIGESDRRWAHEKDALANQLQDLRRQADELERHAGDLKSALEAAQVVARQAEAAAEVSAERALALGKEVAAAQLEVVRLREEGDRLREALDAERQGRERDQTAWLVQLDRARQDLKSAGDARIALERQLREAREAASGLRERLAQSEQRALGLQSRVQESAAEIARLQARADRESQEARAASDQALKEKHRGDALAKALEGAEAVRGKLADDAGSLLLERERLSAENGRLLHELAATRESHRATEGALRLALSRSADIGQVPTKVKPSADGSE